MNRICYLLLALLLAGSAASCRPAAEQKEEPGASPASQDPARSCAACHDQPSRPLVPYLAGQQKGYLLKALRDFRQGARQDAVMGPIAKALNDANIEALATYYASRPAPVSQGKPGPEPAWAVTCMACHGPGGNSQSPEWPSLAGQKKAYQAKALQDFRADARSDPRMNGLAKGLSDKDIQDLATFFAAQQPSGGS